MNKSSRMESHGYPGFVHISLYTAQLIRKQDPAFAAKHLARRGKVKIKSWGEQETFWLLTDSQMEERRAKRAQQQQQQLQQHAPAPLPPLGLPLLRSASLRGAEPSVPSRAALATAEAAPGASGRSTSLRGAGQGGCCRGRSMHM